MCVCITYTYVPLFITIIAVGGSAMNNGQLLGNSLMKRQNVSFSLISSLYIEMLNVAMMFPAGIVMFIGAVKIRQAVSVRYNKSV